MDNDTPTSVPTSFTHFINLPPHIRELIFLYALPRPRTHFLEIYGYTTFNVPPKIRYIPPLPGLFHTSQESRRLSIKHSGGSLIHFNDDPTTNFYFNFAHDIIFLSSRFTPGHNATETFKLRELATLLHYTAIRQIRRIVVTYSSLDSYERIGPLFRYFSSLEVFYVAMMDWWSRKSVRRRLRRGVPKMGVEAERIEGMVERAEAEETSDDEEEEGEKEARMGGRETRRIVEVELRLDE